jgi:hypothetical protein
LSASRTGRLYPQECSWYSFSLGAQSTPGQWYGRSNHHYSTKFTSQHSTIQLYILAVSRKEQNVKFFRPRQEGIWGGVEVQLPSFLTSSLDGCEWLALLPGRFTPVNVGRYSLTGKFCVPYSWAGGLEGKKKFLGHRGVAGVRPPRTTESKERQN